MPRRMTRKQTELLMLLIIIGSIVGGVVKFFEVVGYALPIIAVTIISFLYWWYNESKKKQRLLYLREKYRNEEIVQKIFNQYIWQGQTAEQVIDALDQPVEVDNKVLKTKKKEIWKYGHEGANRFNVRITLENDVVVGWDKKG